MKKILFLILLPCCKIFFFCTLIKYLQTLFCFTQMLYSSLSDICNFSLLISPDLGIADHFIDRAVNVNNISYHCPIFKNLTNQKRWTVKRHILTIASIWRENMLGYLSSDFTCSEKQTVFRECSSRKTVSFEEQIMSKDKYPSIFSSQMEAIVSTILQIFLAMCAVLKIGGYSRISPSFSWRIFSHVTCLDQSRVSEKI